MNAADKNKNTILILAVDDGQPEIVELLLKNGAKLESRNEYGVTALNEAALRDGLPEAARIEIIKLLLAKGARTDVVDVTGNTALMHARERGRSKEVIELLELQSAK